MEYVPLEQHQIGTGSELQESQGTIVFPNPLTMHIPTPMKNDKASKRPLTEVTDIEVDGQLTSKITKDYFPRKGYH